MFKIILLLILLCPPIESRGFIPAGCYPAFPPGKYIIYFPDDGRVIINTDGQLWTADRQCWKGIK